MSEGKRPSWEHVKEILGDALERNPSTRRAFIEAVCDGDADLRAEVESFLPDEETSDAFMAQPATSFFDVPAPEVGSRIGGYEVRRMIGEGGMGRVYEATQEHPHRTVALKVLRPGFLGADAERRFHWEVEALGRLSHAAIASVHEAGMEYMEGGHRVSWFAMEKVDGLPLLAAADELQLDQAARLALFLRVTDGIVHAHQRGVIHRDLKPENILVDAQARPHILDFGIARVADPMASSITTAGEIIGTLAYMSPEQLTGEPDKVDVRSDVYALGGILYRLLTGSAPHDLEGLTLPQVARLLTEEDPRPASRFDRSLRGDLDTILETALARDPERRYATVDALASDVRRVLMGEPIQARPATAWYQMRKFTQRHRGLVVGAAGTLLALVLAVIGTSVGFLRAANERDRTVLAMKQAEEERDHAREINALITGIFASADPDVVGHSVLVVDLLDGAGRRLKAATDLSPLARAGLNMTLGTTYRQLAMPTEARGHLATAAELYRELEGPSALTTLAAIADQVTILADLGDFDAARALLSEFRTTAKTVSSPPAWLIMRPLELDAHLVDLQEDIVGYVAVCQELLEGWSDLAEADSGEVLTARNNLGAALLGNGQVEEAHAVLLEGIHHATRAKALEGDQVSAMRANLAQALEDLGRYDESLALYDELVPMAHQLWGPLHSKTMTLRGNRASLLYSMGHVDEALEEYREILAARLEKNGELHVDTSTARSNVSVMYTSLGQFEEAIEQLEAAIDAFDRGDFGDPVQRLRFEMNLASALDSGGRVHEARLLMTRVLEGLESRLGEEHMQCLIARNNLAMLLVKEGLGEEAVPLAEKNQQIVETTQAGHPMNTFPMRMNLGRALAAAKQFERARSELLAVEESLKEDDSTPPHQTARIREVLHDFYLDWDKPEEAARWMVDR